MEEDRSVQASIAHTFREALANTEMSHAELARLLTIRGMSVSPSSVTKMLNGDRGISLEMAMRLCDALGVDWNRLYEPLESPEDAQWRRFGRALYWVDSESNQAKEVWAGVTLAQRYLIGFMLKAGYPVDPVLAEQDRLLPTPMFKEMLSERPSDDPIVELDDEESVLIGRALESLASATSNAYEAEVQLRQASTLLKTVSKGVDLVGDVDGTRSAGN